jgi:hypothetical protein
VKFAMDKSWERVQKKGKGSSRMYARIITTTNIYIITSSSSRGCEYVNKYKKSA